MEHIKSKVVVYSTTDYKRFRFVEGNRKTETPKSKGKRARIMQQIKEGNDILDECPILVSEVNSHLDIKDGQNRFLIAKELGRPVHYIIKKQSLSLYNVAKINSNVEKWTGDEYINCYATEGNEHYKKLEKFKKTYGFAVGNCLTLLTTGTILRDSGADDLRLPFEQGNFEIKKWKEAVHFAELCKTFESFPAWNSRGFIIAIGRILNAELCDFDVLIKKYKRDPAKLTTQPNWKMYVNNLELIYNYDNSKRRPII